VIGGNLTPEPMRQVQAALIWYVGLRATSHAKRNLKNVGLVH